MKHLYSILAVLLIASVLQAQAPSSFKYQAVLRDARGNTRANTTARIGIDLLQGSAIGITVYRETHNVTTDSYGLINIEIGKGISSFGSMPAIDWSAGPYFIKITVDGLEMGTSQLLSVPYALYAKTAGNGFSGSYNDLTAKPALFDGTWSSLTGRPAFAPVAMSGSYNDLTNKPVIFSGAWASLTGKPTYALVASTGNYSDLLNKPVLFNGTWTSLTLKPTTVDGFGITDAVKTFDDQIIAGNKTFTGAISAVDETLSGKLGVNGNTSIGTLSPDVSAVLDVSSTSQGFLPPRMTYAQKSAIVTPAAGLIIWCSNCGLSGEIQVFNGTTWTNMIGGAASASLPLIANTPKMSVITSTSAIFDGIISDDGGSPVTVRGVCWNTNPDPTIQNMKTSDGPGTGAFTSSITGLIAGTTYYSRAYSTNNVGTSYGNQISFTTPTGNSNHPRYLRFESYYSGDSEQVNVYEIQAYTGGVNVALTKPGYANSYEYSGNWTSNGSQAVDGNGFSRWSSYRGDPGPDAANPHFIVIDLQSNYALDSIILNIQGFDNWKQNFDFSVSEDSVSWNSIGNGDNITGIFTYYFGTRPVTIPTLTTTDITLIGSTTATSGGTITSDGGATITGRGVCWSTTANPTIALSTKTTDSNGTGPFISSITGLTGGTIYYLRSYATNSAGTNYGNQFSFMTLPVYSNKYLFRDTVSSGTFSNYGALNTGYAVNSLTNTFSFDLWVKPTRTVTMAGESNTCMGGVSVPLANSNQNWAIVPINGGYTLSLGIGLTIGTNGVMVGEHTGNLLVSRLSYSVSITDWVHVAVVYRPDSIFLYLNGDLVRSRHSPCTSTINAPNSLVGSMYSPDFKGNIDEFRLWDIPLTRQEVKIIKDKKLMTQVTGLRYYAGFDNGNFERTLGDLGTANMTVTDLMPSKHIKTSSWNLVRYSGSTISTLTPY